ncbi:MAG: hypothetical protein QOE65_2576 [Solirubrobacteraceae bacterium]|jgi:plastocyanin|nr:hypothetical protein [Solirubrobacteraceae bacterium]
MRPRNLAVLLLLPVLVAAGCGSKNKSSGSGQANNTTSTPAAGTTASTPAATTPSSGRSAIAVDATEFKFTPSTLTAKAGAATFKLTNTGGAPHALEIQGQGMEKSSQVIQGGQSTDLKVTLKPGKYQFYCPVDNHKQMGMTGTLTVS